MSNNSLIGNCGQVIEDYWHQFSWTWTQHGDLASSSHEVIHSQEVIEPPLYYCLSHADSIFTGPREGAFFHFQLYYTVLVPCRPKTPAFHRGTHKQLRRHLESLQVKVLQPLSVWYCAPVHIIMQGMEVDMTC